MIIKFGINLSKIPKEDIKKSEKSGDSWINVDMYVNNMIDQYGNIASLSIYKGKDEPKIYIGNGKLIEYKEPTDDGEGPAQVTEPESDDLPF